MLMNGSNVAFPLCVVRLVRHRYPVCQSRRLSLSLFSLHSAFNRESEIMSVSFSKKFPHLKLLILYRVDSEGYESEH